MSKNKEYEKLYKKIGLERAAIRKAERKKNDNRLCKCGHNRRSYDLHPCPYSEDIHDNHDVLLLFRVYASMCDGYLK